MRHSFNMKWFELDMNLTLAWIRELALAWNKDLILQQIKELILAWIRHGMNLTWRDFKSGHFLNHFFIICEIGVTSPQQ